VIACAILGRSLPSSPAWRRSACPGRARRRSGVDNNCLGPAQPRDAFGGRVAVGARAACGLDQLVDHMLGRRQIGIAHAEVDDVGAACARLGLQAIDLLEDIRGQALDTIEIRHLEVPLVFWGRFGSAFSTLAEARPASIGLLSRRLGRGRAPGRRGARRRIGHGHPRARLPVLFERALGVRRPARRVAPGFFLPVGFSVGFIGWYWSWSGAGRERTTKSCAGGGVCRRRSVSRTLPTIAPPDTVSCPRPSCAAASPGRLDRARAAASAIRTRRRLAAPPLCHIAAHSRQRVGAPRDLRADAFASAQWIGS